LSRKYSANSHIFKLNQAFIDTPASIPDDIPLTGFSILFARLKGDFEKYTVGIL